MWQVAKGWDMKAGEIIPHNPTMDNFRNYGNDVSQYYPTMAGAIQDLWGYLFGLDEDSRIVGEFKVCNTPTLRGVGHLVQFISL